MTSPQKGSKTFSDFDDRNIDWYSPDVFAGLGIYICDVDNTRNTFDFLLRLPPNVIIDAHRHVADTKTFVIKGEHRIYEVDGSLREVRHAGTYTSTPAGGVPHREGAGDEGGIVLFSMRGDGPLFELMNEALDIIGILDGDGIRGLQAEQNRGKS
jgi:hypothetical protein